MRHFRCVGQATHGRWRSLKWPFADVWWPPPALYSGLRDQENRANSRTPRPPPPPPSGSSAPLEKLFADDIARFGEPGTSPLLPTPPPTTTTTATHAIRYTRRPGATRFVIRRGAHASIDRRIYGPPDDRAMGGLGVRMEVTAFTIIEESAAPPPDIPAPRAALRSKPCIWYEATSPLPNV